MRITDIRVVLVENSKDRLKAYCAVTFDECFVVRDLKIIEGANGPFVAMPSRRLTKNCPSCREKNPARARFCNECGTRLPQREVGENAPPREFSDIAHPINADFRDQIHRALLQAYAAARKNPPSDRSDVRVDPPQGFRPHSSDSDTADRSHHRDNPQS